MGKFTRKARVYFTGGSHAQDIPVSFGPLCKIGQAHSFSVLPYTVGRVLCYLKTQHHSWDCSLATPMVTNADPPVDCAHARETVRGAVVFVPPAPSACVTCIYTNMQVRIWW